MARPEGVGRLIPIVQGISDHSEGTDSVIYVERFNADLPASLSMRSGTATPLIRFSLGLVPSDLDAVGREHSELIDDIAELRLELAEWRAIYMTESGICSGLD